MVFDFLDEMLLCSFWKWETIETHDICYCCDMETTELCPMLNITRDVAAAAATWKPEKLTQLLRWDMGIIHFVSRIKVLCVPALSVV